MTVEQMFSRAYSGMADSRVHQRMTALDNANAVRGFRAELKKDLKFRRANILDYLGDPPELIGSMKVFDLLMATPRYGRVKINELLRQCGISMSKQIGDLTPRQRTELISRLRRS